MVIHTRRPNRHQPDPDPKHGLTRTLLTSLLELLCCTPRLCCSLGLSRELGQAVAADGLPHQQPSTEVVQPHDQHTTHDRMARLQDTYSVSQE